LTGTERLISSCFLAQETDEHHKTFPIADTCSFLVERDGNRNGLEYHLHITGEAKSWI